MNRVHKETSLIKLLKKTNNKVLKLININSIKLTLKNLKRKFNVRKRIE